MTGLIKRKMTYLTRIPTCYLHTNVIYIVEKIEKYIKDTKYSKYTDTHPSLGCHMTRMECL